MRQVLKVGPAPKVGEVALDELGLNLSHCNGDARETFLVLSAAQPFVLFVCSCHGEVCFRFLPRALPLLLFVHNFTCPWLFSCSCDPL